MESILGTRRQRALQRLLVVPAVLRLLTALLLRRPVELWIGDSHAMTSNRPVAVGSFLPGADGVLVLRVGPRLMWSLATNGFPARTRRLARTLGRLARPGRIVPVFMAGEIDVRAHLSQRPDQPLDFVAPYVDRCLEVAAELRADRAYVAVPPPPSDGIGFDMWYPVTGSVEERLRAFKELRAGLEAAVGDRPGTGIVDFTDAVAHRDGRLRPDLSDDGAHTNARALPLIRDVVRRQVVLPGRG